MLAKAACDFPIGLAFGVQAGQRVRIGWPNTGRGRKVRLRWAKAATLCLIKLAVFCVNEGDGWLVLSRVSSSCLVEPKCGVKGLKFVMAFHAVFWVKKDCTHLITQNVAGLGLNTHILPLLRQYRLDGT